MFTIKLVKINPSFVLIAFVFLLQNCGFDSSERLISTPDQPTQEMVAAAKKAEEAERFDEAIGSYEAVLKHIDKHKTKERVEILQEMGKVYNQLGHYEKAVQSLEEALKLQGTLEDSRAYMRIVLYLGNAYKNLGRLKQALKAYEETYRLSRLYGDMSMEGASHIGFGNIYLNLGQTEMAADHYRRARILLKDRQKTAARTYAIVLHNLGWAYFKLGKYELAQTFLEEALDLRTKQNNPRGVGSTKTNLGIMAYDRGEMSNAYRYLSEALELSKKTDDAKNQAVTLLYLALTLAKDQKETDALNKIEQSITLCRAGGYLEDLWHALYVYADILTKRNEPAEQIETAYRESIEIVEKIGFELEGRYERYTFFSDKQDVYENYVSFLMAQGRIKEAFVMAERFRFAAFSISNERYLKTSEDIENRSMSFAQIESEAKKLLSHLGGSLPISDEGALVTLRKLANIYQSKVVHESDTLSILAPEELTALLDDQTVIISFFPIASGFLGWIVQAEGITAVEIPISHESLKNEIDSFQHALSHAIDSTEQARKLFHQILGPINDKISDSYRWVILAPPSLFKLPWVALIDEEGRFIGENHLVTVNASTAFIHAFQRTKPQMSPSLTPFLTVGDQAYLGGDRDASLYETHISPRAFHTLPRRHFKQAIENVNILNIVLPLYLTEEPMFAFMYTSPEHKEDDRLMMGEILRISKTRKAMILSQGFVYDQSLNASYKQEMIEFLLSQGVPAMIVASWPLPDAELSEFLVKFHDFSKGSSLAEAFQQTQLEFIQNGISPAVWSALTFYGNPW